MGKLAFPLDKELTGPDRVVLNILQKEYELYEAKPAESSTDAAEDSDDSGVKHSEIVTPSPEGRYFFSSDNECLRSIQRRYALLTR